MADVDSGHANLAMDIGEEVKSVESEENSRAAIDASKPTDSSGTDELQLRVDMLTTNDAGSGIWIPDDTAKNDDKAVVDVDDQTSAVSFSRERPFSASMRSRTTVASSRSRVSMSPSIRTSDFTSNNLFSHKMELFNKALADCTETMVQADPDGQVQASWLLTEIDHWNNEKERLLILTDNSMLIVKYDFIKSCVIEGKRIPLVTISKLQIGDIVYPSKSLMPYVENRDYGGVRVYYGDPDTTTFAQRWNPWSRAVPYVTLTHHLLAYNRHENETVTYNADDMAESLVAAVDGARRRFVGENRDIDRVTVDDSPIVINSYISMVSVIHNQSKLGFYLERGGISF